MTRFCKQCGTPPLPEGCPANMRYCKPCGRVRIRESKRISQAKWRSSTKTLYSRTEREQREAAAFSEDYSKVILSADESQEGDGDGSC